MLLCPCRIAVQRKGAAADHTFSVQSLLAVTKRLPSGLQAPHRTTLVCSRKTAVQPRVATSHSATRQLSPPRSTMRPSGLHAQQRNMILLSPVYDAVQLRVVTSHTLSSLLATHASERPSGLQEHDHTSSSSCSIVAEQSCVTASHTCTVLSQAQDAIVRPSGLQEQAKIQFV